MDYTLLKQILEHVEAYEAGHASRKIEDFTVWLNTQLFKSDAAQAHGAQTDLLIAFQLMYVAKELKRRSKGVFAESNLSSVDEYSFLLHLNHGQSFRKMELVDLHNLEAPTGIEIIKRLLKNGLIEEFPDEDDRRAKRVAITPSGIEELNRLTPQMDRVFTELSSSLSLQERVQLSGILNNLIH